MKPPRFARDVLLRAVAAHLREAVGGDLDELFEDEARRSPRRARLAYWRRAAEAAWHLRGRRSRPAVHRGDSVMHTIWKDLSHGLRLFITQPGYAFAAVITLALAIGANTLIFSIVNVLVLKPLPIQQPERLAWIFVTGPNAGPDRAGVSLPEYAAYRGQAPAFARLAASRWRAVTMRADTGSERVMSHVVIGDLQGLWGLAAERGRTLTAEDERAGAPRVVALSHRFWVVRFGAAPDIVGRDLIVDGVGHTVVGVLAPNIELGTLSEIDVWLPYTGDPTLAARTERGWRSVGRLAVGATVGDAHAQLAAIASGLATGPSASERRERPSAAPTRGWCCRSCPRWSACCWCSPAPTS
jgi:putative ABC transport system permease protein